jgi:catechol-2,3-dioxygenase
VPVVFDHSIIPSRNKKESAEFYARIFGFENMGEQTERLYAVRVNDESILFFENSTDPDSPRAQGTHHCAFAMDAKRFNETFARIQASGILYGGRYDQPANLKGPGKSPGARGQSSSVYFKDPSGNSLEIRTY